MPSFLNNLDLNSNELRNAKIHLLASDPGSPVDGQVWVNTTSNTLKIRLNGVTVSLGRLDQISAPTAALAMNSQRITGLLDGVAATDAATVSQVDAARTGLDVKASVRAATTAAGTLASSFANGQTVDGIVLATGNRILLKNQAAGAENGIYTVNASGAPTRATDADVSSEVSAGMFTFVEVGTANADTGWVLTTDDPITLGTTALVFAKFSAAATGISRYAALIGNGSLTAIAVTHNLGTQDVVVQMRRVSDNAEVQADIVYTDTNTVTITFAVAPASNAIRVVVLG